MNKLKEYVKRTIGHTLISFGTRLPKTRPVFKKLGLRTTEELFGGREVSVPLARAQGLVGGYSPFK